MNEQEIDQAVRRVRACTHDRGYYLDTNRNRCCVVCDAPLREIPGAVEWRQETRTLTNGWIMPMWGFMREQENRIRADVGLPLLTDEPEIREQSRWVTDWVDQ